MPTMIAKLFAAMLRIRTRTNCNNRCLSAKLIACDAITRPDSQKNHSGDLSTASYEYNSCLHRCLGLPTTNLNVMYT